MTEWRPMETAPQDGTDIEVKVSNGDWYTAHFACDLSGEEQPPFRGWFTPVKNSEGRTLFFHQLMPTHWRPIASR